MEIIPVIDVMGEKVVHAQGGDRAAYPLLQSLLSDKTDPIGVISDLLRFADFSHIYIADLDAISEGKRNHQLYGNIADRFPQIEFYLDSGIQNKKDWNEFDRYLNIVPIIASETLNELSCLQSEHIRSRSILSLDYKQGQFLGLQALLSQPDLWSPKIIVMNLDCIAGQSGPDLSLLTQLQQQSPQSEFIAAGGVRTEQDLLQLQAQGISQVLIASALHDGRISAEVVQSLLGTTDRF